MSPAWLSLPLGAMAMMQAPSGSDDLHVSCVPGLPVMVSLDEADRRLAGRVAAIIAVAKVGDRRRLADFVSPDFHSLLWSGDVGRGPSMGVDGAVQMARVLEATSFEFDAPFNGPLSGDICGPWEIEVRIMKANGTHGYDVHFRFERGLLVHAEGREIEIIRGRLDGSREGH